MTICTALEESRRFFGDTVRALPESEAILRLTPESWSIAGIVEHVVIAERSLLARFDDAERSGTSLRDSAREARIASKLRDRSGKVQASERAWPADRFATLAEALEQFVTARDRTIRFAREHEEELYCTRVAHPLIGPVNGVEMLLIMAAHSDRHAAQILEIRDRAA